MPFLLRHADVTAYVDLWATLVELGECAPWSTPDGSTHDEFDPDRRWEDACTVRLSGAQLPAGHDRSGIPEEVQAWPRHWQAGEGAVRSGERGDLVDSQDAVGRMVGRVAATPPAAEATAVRPLD